MKSDTYYKIEKIGKTDKYRLIFNDVVISEDLELHEAVLMLETLIRSNDDISETA